MNSKQIETSVRQSRISALKSIHGTTRSARPPAFSEKNVTRKTYWPESIVEVEDRLFHTYNVLRFDAYWQPSV